MDQPPAHQAEEIDTLHVSIAKLETKRASARRLFEDGEISTATFVNIDAELSSQIENARQQLAQASTVQ